MTAVVRSLWQSGRVRLKALEWAAGKITYDQKNIADAIRSHEKRARRRLRALGITLSRLRCCILQV